MAIVDTKLPPIPAWGVSALRCCNTVATQLAKDGRESDAAALDRLEGYIRIGIHEQRKADTNKEPK